MASKIGSDLLKAVDRFGRVQSLSAVKTDFRVCGHSCDIYSPSQQLFNFLRNHFTTAYGTFLEWHQFIALLTRQSIQRNGG